MPSSLVMPCLLQTPALRFAGGGALDDLVGKVVRGDTSAWRDLWIAVEPMLFAITGNPRITGILSERVDDRRNIVLLVMERLCADNFNRLQLYLESIESHTGGSFKAWLRTVATRASIDYVRSHEHYRDRRGAADTDSAPPRWVRHVPILDSEPSFPSSDVVQTVLATKVLDQAGKLLTDPQRHALQLWLESFDHVEMARRLGLADDKAADRLVRAALKRLRSHFAADREGSKDPEVTG